MVTTWHLFAKASPSLLQHPLKYLHWWLRLSSGCHKGVQVHGLSWQKSSQWGLSPLGQWHRGLFAASSEMHPLISQSQGGLGALSAGEERLIMIIAESKCFSRHMTGRAALSSTSQRLLQLSFPWHRGWTTLPGLHSLSPPSTLAG